MDSERKPFPESIVNALDLAREENLQALGGLILRTKISQNHDAIVEAWTRASHRYDVKLAYLGVVESLKEQKRDAAEQDMAKAAGATA